MNADHDAVGEDVPELTDAERNGLEVRWYQEKMLRYVDLLLAFAVRHRAEILREAAGSLDSAALREATKRMIVRRGSVHMLSELTDQKLEMDNECWYRGQEGHHDRTRIQIDWAQRHGKDWRQWRLREYLFVVDRCEDRIVERLLTSAALD